MSWVGVCDAVGVIDAVGVCEAVGVIDAVGVMLTVGVGVGVGSIPARDTTLYISHFLCKQRRLVIHKSSIVYVTS